jgi:hypothetical protein
MIRENDSGLVALGNKIELEEELFDGEVTVVILEGEEELV